MSPPAPARPRQMDVWGLGCLLWELVTAQDLPHDEPVLGQRAASGHHAAWAAEYARRYATAVLDLV